MVVRPVARCVRQRFPRVRSRGRDERIHESISTFLLFLLLLAFEPFKRREGSLMVLFLLLYPIHRFIDEMLRNDTERYAPGMTFSQFVSFGVFAGAIGLCVWLWRGQPAFKPTDPQPA